MYTSRPAGPKVAAVDDRRFGPSNRVVAVTVLDGNPALPSRLLSDLCRQTFLLRPSFRRAVFTLIVLNAGCHRPAEPTEPLAPAPRAEPKAPGRGVRFVEITREAGVDFVHENAAAGEKLLPETMGSGVAFLDYDVDGDPDLFLVNSSPWPGQKARGTVGNRLYRNDGRGHFVDVTEASGLTRTLFGMGVAVGDYDNDGDPDLYLTALDGGVLYRNDGGRFVDVTSEAHAQGGGGWLTSAAFFDMENDGDLDLFLCRYLEWSPDKDRAESFQLRGKGRAYGAPSAFAGTFNTLLRNDGGTFTDVGEAAGIRVRTPEKGLPVGKSLGIAPYDVDGDGLVDLAVANDTVPNFLFLNLGKGRFEEVGITSGIAFDSLGTARGAMGIDWSHFRNDAALGLAVGNFANEMTALYVAPDPKRMEFADQASLYGLGAATQPPLKFGLFFFDYDLDGRPDLLWADGHLEPDIASVDPSQSHAQPAQLFRNTGEMGRALFVQVGAESAGADLFVPMVGRGSAYADIDGDGDLDVVLTANGGPARLFRNDGGNADHGIRLDLIGRGSNRDAIGAKVTVHSGRLVQHAQLFLAKGYLASVEHTMTFGLSEESQADEVRITWPSGKTAEFSRPSSRTSLQDRRGERPGGRLDAETVKSGAIRRLEPPRGVAPIVLLKHGRRPFIDACNSDTARRAFGSSFALVVV